MLQPYLLIIAILLIGCQAGEAPVQEEKPTVEKVSEPVEEEIKPPFEITLDYVMGKFDPAKDTAFTKVDPKYCDRAGLYLRKDTYRAFRQMHTAAQKDGINLIIRSATRNFNYQKQIWEGKWTGARKVGGQDLSKTIADPKTRALKILELSSMPSTSRHHWGTDIDLNAFTNEYFESGKGLKIYNWLQANAAQYGFCQPYSPKGEGGRPHGYNEEKWHWSYLPVAVPLTNFARKHMRDSLIEGFAGAVVAPEIGVVEKYILGINPECQ